MPYVLECLGLYIKKGGFTYDEAEARQYPTAREALRARVSGWVVKRVGREGSAVAKAKTKVIPFETQATEVRPGTWEWEVGGLTWYFTSGVGLNCGVKQGEDKYVPLVCVKKLDEAGMFSQGFDAGRASAVREEKKGA